MSITNHTKAQTTYDMIKFAYDHMEIIEDKVIDTFDGFEDIIGTYDTFDEARAAAKERAEDTDGECQVNIFAKTKKGYKVII